MNFYTNIAHELRTPLTLILGPLEDIKDDSEIGGKLQRKIKLIYNSALRLSTLINQLMEFRKSETHNRQITVRRGNLSRLVTDVVSHYSDMNNNENVNVILKIEDDYAVCLFDPEVVTIILDNLISNALKYTPYGTISIKLTDVYDADHQEMYEITVEDTGYGIQKDALPLIFDRYYQVGGKHQVSGSGIGLSLVKSLVTLHEGVITVDSEPGKGTIFHFSLYKENQYINALHDDAIVKEDVVMCQDHIPDKDTNTKPILAIVEDNTDIRNYIKESLQDDFIIIEAPDGEKGWDIIENNVPDIIISDIMMPLMNGVELCRKIKRNVYTSHIPVILLTAKDTIADKEEGYESGADSYLTKPFSAKLLKVRVRNIMEQRLLIMRKYIESAVNDRHDTDNGESSSASIQQTNLGINKLDSEFITKLTSVIKENLASDKLKVDFLADKMCMSHSAFYRKVKSMTGKSANEYIRKVRLHRAMELLERTSNNVTEAAYMTGFGDLAYFRACFKSEFGINPSEVVKQK
jgi:DNA-binding response OmpR family regulator/two-component sensor histidine kinase